MGRKSTKADKNRYQLAREAAGFTREAAAEATRLSVTRIVRIENGSITPDPYDVLTMSRAYKAPSLHNYYCAKVCSLGKKYIDEVTVTELSQVVMGVLDAINNLETKRSGLIRLTADGKISAAEAREFYEILGELDRISDLTDALKLWNETMVAKGLMPPDGH